MCLVLKREEIETFKTRVMVQTLVDKEHAQEAWDNYTKQAMPWMETAKNREKQDWIKKLSEEVAKGPLTVKPVEDPNKFRSRLNTKVIDREALNPVAAKLISRLSSKMAPSISVRK